MRTLALVVLVAALVVPSTGRAQHSHGGGMDTGPRLEKQKPPSEPQRGVLPAGTERPIEVLLLSYGFSPQEIRAVQGEQVILSIRRSNEAHCKAGLSIPARDVHVQLPVGETVPVTLKLDRAETLAVGCEGEEGVAASIVVAPR